jgi:hypothetical protein
MPDLDSPREVSVSAVPCTDDLVHFLVATWAEALGTEVHPDSDFLALGGTSLAAVWIAEALAARHPHEGVDVVALTLIFESPSLLSMAEDFSRFLASVHRP